MEEKPPLTLLSRPRAVLLAVRIGLKVCGARLGMEKVAVPLLKRETSPAVDLTALPEKVPVLSAELSLKGSIDPHLSLPVPPTIGNQILAAVD